MELHFHMTTKGFTPSILLSLLTSMGWLSANSSAPDATATVFNNLKLNDVIESPNIGFPDAAPFPYDNKRHSHLLHWWWRLSCWDMANETILKKKLDQRRAYKARCVVQNAIGIRTNRWHCLWRRHPQRLFHRRC